MWAVALTPIGAGETVAVEGAAVAARQDIPQGHKVALAPIAAGAEVVKYGCPIGRAKTDIRPGEWVHTHNLGHRTGGRAPPWRPAWRGRGSPPCRRRLPGVPTEERRRGDPERAVDCPPQWAASTVWAQTLVRRLGPELDGKVDGVYAWPHPYGCSQMGR